MPNRAARYRIFVSYSRKDSGLVNPLVRLLMVADKKIFQDATDIDPGAHWRAVITMAIETCDKMLLFWCAHSSTSTEVEKEYAGAIRLKKTLVPVLLDDTPLSNKLSGYQAIDLRTALGPHKEGRVARRSNARAEPRDDNGGSPEEYGGTELGVLPPNADAMALAARQLRAGVLSLS